MPQLERIRKTTLSELVVARLKGYILDRGLREGDRLPTEHELARRFGVSRVSVREATKALSFLGLIRAAPRRGLTLGRLDMARLADCLGFHFAASSYPREQLVRTRLALEAGALAEAMERVAADDGVYRELAACNEELGRARNAAEFLAGDAALHRRLLEASRIEPVVVFGDLIDVFFRRFQAEIPASQVAREHGVAGHRRLLAALRARRLDEAQHLLRAHLAHYFAAAQDKQRPAPAAHRRPGSGGGRATVSKKVPVTPAKPARPAKGART